MSFALTTHAKARYDSNTEQISIKDAVILFFMNKQEIDYFLKIMEWLANAFKFLGKFIAIFSAAALVVTIPDDILAAPIPAVNLLAWGDDISWFFAGYALCKLCYLYFGHNHAVKKLRAQELKLYMQQQRADAKAAKRAQKSQRKLRRA